ncbi:MAG: UDP-N-acetylglucosamine 2-epimerase (non-hydrolyzing) [Candidatus Latescibacterota bacterium]
MKVLLIAGARPNFMKIAPIFRESQLHPGVDCRIVHTGQHYDHDMSQAFFDDLGIPAPAYSLNAGSGTHAEQTARIMVAFEPVCMDMRPDWVVVVGDVNSTLACAIVAKKLGIMVAHVEAGLRSFDLSMPEEINRMVTDAISDLFFVTEQSGVANLHREGKSAGQVHMVGHVMIDNLLHQVRELEDMAPESISVHEAKPKGPYAFLTMHRPSNVDHKDTFAGIARALNRIAEDMPIIFPVHPRTRSRLEQFALDLSPRITLLSPLGFKDALFLWKDAKLVLTDSGGLQEETTALGVPCLTLRENTERPITVDMGTNLLAGNTEPSILEAYEKISRNEGDQAKIPPLWDGQASRRIWSVLLGLVA